MDGPAFAAYVENVLVPELAPGTVVILDNLATHKNAAAAKAIRDAGCWFLFLPPYSPDLNPIENVFSKIKNRLRSLACRSREQLWEKMQSVLDEVTARDARNCFRHCGYATNELGML